MKQILSTTLVALAITIATAHAEDSDATNTIAAHVQAGLFAEEVNHDFATATAAYESAIAQFDATRPLAATALFRLAEIHRRAGNTEEAETLYARVAREFHDQTELATLAAEHLPDGASAAELTTNELLAQIEPGMTQSAVIRFLGPPDEILNLPDSQYHITRYYDRYSSEPGIPYVVIFGPFGAVGYGPETGEIRTFLEKNGYPEPSPKVPLLSDIPIIGPQFSQNLRGINSLERASQVQSIEEAEEIARLKELLQESPDLLYARQENGRTRLYNAIVEGKLQVVKFLISQGFDLSLMDELEKNPLTLAVEEGHQSIVEFFLKKGEDVNSKSSTGYTPLHSATAKGFLSIAKVLLENGADVNAKTQNGSTPLHNAIQFDSLQRLPLVQLLISHGADVNAATTDNITPLHYATLNGYVRIVELLLEHSADVNVHASEGETPLHLAAQGGHVQIAELLLEYSADVNATNAFGGTPLHTAALRSRRTETSQVVKLLIEHGADVNALTNHGRTPLDYAEPQLAELLRQHGGTEGKFHATISIIEPFEEERIVLWDRSEKMTFREALEKAGVEIDDIASGRFISSESRRMLRNINSVLGSAENPEIENGAEIEIHLDPQ